MPFLDFTDERIKRCTSYLSNRKFIISIENYLDKASIRYGVSQGSILGPLLFYFMATTCHRLRIMNFYYMSMILVWSSNISIGNNRGTSKSRFSTLIDWFVDNRLSVYFGEDKTKSILFSPKHG